MGAWLYILCCADGSYYTGTTHADLDQRIAEHQDGRFDGYTSTRQPVVLVYSEHFDQIVDAIATERKIKGWSRAKKEALMTGNFKNLSKLAKRRGLFRGHGSRRVASRRSSP